jgi:hypothetical protein
MFTMRAIEITINNYSVTNTINIITALSFWFLTFLIKAFVGDDSSWFLVYLIIALAVTLSGNFIKGKISRFFLIVNVACLVVPLQEVFGMIAGLFESWNERFLVKHLLLILSFAVLCGLFIYSTVRLFKSKK